MSEEEKQKGVCRQYGAEFVAAPVGMKVGISAAALRGEQPLHGLRHAPMGDTTGWYIWSGAYSDDPDFFQPLHVEHLSDACPASIKFLGLAPGWRFLFADGHEDAWYDENLLRD